MKKNKNVILIVLGAILIFVIAIVIIVLVNKNSDPKPNSESGYVAGNTGPVDIVEFFDGKDKVINNCVFSELKFTTSSKYSEFYGKFTSNNDNIVGNVNIKFTLYDKNNTVVDSFSNHLKDVKKGEEKILFSQYGKPVKDVASIEITFE